MRSLGAIGALACGACHSVRRGRIRGRFHPEALGALAAGRMTAGRLLGSLRAHRSLRSRGVGLLHARGQALGRLLGRAFSPSDGKALRTGGLFRRLFLFSSLFCSRRRLGGSRFARRRRNRRPLALQARRAARHGNAPLRTLRRIPGSRSARHVGRSGSLRRRGLRVRGLCGRGVACSRNRGLAASGLFRSCSFRSRRLPSSLAASLASRSLAAGIRARYRLALNRRARRSCRRALLILRLRLPTLSHHGRYALLSKAKNLLRAISARR